MQVECVDDILSAEKLLFPGVGSYGQAMDILVKRGYVEPLREYIQVRRARCRLARYHPRPAATHLARSPLQADRPFLGVCLGLQLLYDGGDENGGVEGLGVIPGRVGEFDRTRAGLPVPHIGWNNVIQKRPSRLLCGIHPEERFYFVHSFRALPKAEDGDDWVLATGQYGEEFVAVVSRGNVHACQFHPEKSGERGQAILANFLDYAALEEPAALETPGDGARPALRPCQSTSSHHQGTTS